MNFCYVFLSLQEELSSLLSKVKDVISENENLHEKQKSKLIKSVFDHLETETETETEIEGRNVSGQVTNVYLRIGFILFHIKVRKI